MSIKFPTEAAVGDVISCIFEDAIPYGSDWKDYVILSIEENEDQKNEGIFKTYILYDTSKIVGRGAVIANEENDTNIQTVLVSFPYGSVVTSTFCLNNNVQEYQISQEVKFSISEMHGWTAKELFPRTVTVWE